MSALPGPCGIGDLGADARDFIDFLAAAGQRYWQILPLNPPEISGVCGRLLCCLTFEQDQYVAAKGQFPKVGTRLQWATGQARVIRIDVMKDLMVLYNEDADENYEVTADEWRELQERQRAFQPAPFGKPVAPESAADDDSDDEANTAADLVRG